MFQNKSKIRIAPIVLDLNLICDFRMHLADILDTGIVEHTPETIRLMRNAYSADDTSNRAKVDFIESKIKNSGKNRPRLHAEVLASVLAFIRIIKPQSVLDIGFGEGLLIRALMQESGVKMVTGVETDPQQIKIALALGNVANNKNVKVDLYQKDATTGDLDNLKDYDVAVLMEVVEHIADQDWINHIFSLNPKFLIVTTPNYEFNVLYNQKNLGADGLRDPDHKFEFTRNEFKVWAKKHANIYGYLVSFLPIGPADIEHGSSGQMVVFQKSGLKEIDGSRT